MCGQMPFSAIEMHPSPDGFDYPVVDAAKCTSCGLCLRSCPAENRVDTDSEVIRAAVLQGGDPDELAQSSSGGVFSLLAKRVLTGGGRVTAPLGTVSIASGISVYPIFLILRSFKSPNMSRAMRVSRTPMCSTI